MRRPRAKPAILHGAFLCAALLFGLAACGSEKKTGGAGESSSVPVPGGEAGAPGDLSSLPPGGQMSGRMFTGTVIETMNSGGYTYVNVDNGSEKIWALKR